MTSLRRRRLTFLPMVSVMAFPVAAHAADCTAAGATPLVVGTVASVPAGAPRGYSVALGAGEGVIVDVSSLVPTAARVSESADDEHDHEGGSPAPPSTRSLRLCDAAGRLLAPQPGEVFEKGGSVSATSDGERLRFLAAHAGTYLIRVDAADTTREILVRRREAGVAQAPIISIALDTERSGTASSSQPVIYSFSAPAGQWVQIRSTSEKDTLLRLAGPDRQGAYSVLAENDDSDGLNPMIRRRLPVAGTYYVQVDSLSAEAGTFSLGLARIAAPKPPPPPAALRPGASVGDKLADGDDVRLYALAVEAGHSYTLELTASYDGVVAIGVPNPVEPEDGKEGADAGFSEVKSQDSGTSGTEKLNFTARSTGRLLVRVKSFGIGETDGAYTLKAIDNGG
jgi:hypothetical protein